MGAGLGWELSKTKKRRKRRPSHASVRGLICLRTGRRVNQLEWLRSLRNPWDPAAVALRRTQASIRQKILDTPT